MVLVLVLRMPVLHSSSLIVNFLLRAILLLLMSLGRLRGLDSLAPAPSFPLPARKARNLVARSTQ